MTETSRESHRVHDPSVLRAISHPVRNRILSELSAQGSLRAADLARELDIPANQASFHLRSLAKHGLVEEDPGAARDKRDRVWRMVHDEGLRIDLDELSTTPGGKAAALVFTRNAASWGHAVVDAAYGAERVPGEHRSITDSSLRLADEEARQVSAELNEVIDRWARRTRGGGPDDGRATFLYMGLLQRHPGRTTAPAGEGGAEDGAEDGA